MKISKIFLYNEPAISEIKIESLGDFLRETFPIKVEIRENILKFAKEDTAQKIASCRAYNPRRGFEKHTPTREEILFEEVNFVNTEKTENIIMYDGFEIQDTLTELISPNESTIDSFHVFFTNKLTCTFDYNDYRYHGRALIGTNPSIISTTGIIEAPAKPREYYFELMNNYQQGINVNLIKEKFKGTFLEYNDSRLAEIIKGYLLQAIFYYEIGDAFCDQKDCRLLNAHWQKDLLYSQIEIGKLCQKHEKILENLTRT